MESNKHSRPKDMHRSHNMTRAQLKKERKKFKVGDIVTWGSRVCAHRVIKVLYHGVWVDTRPCDSHYTSVYVVFDKNRRHGVYHIGFRGPLFHAERACDENGCYNKGRQVRK